MYEKQRRSFLWCWRCGALGFGSLTLDMNCADRAQPYPTPFPTAPNHTTHYNPLQPSQPPTTPTLQHSTMPPPIYPHTPQYSTPHPPPARDLFPGRWVPSIQRSVSFAYSQKCQHQASFSLSWQYASSGFIPPLSKNFDPLHRHHLWGLSASHLARCPLLVARDVNPWATLLSITVLTIFII